jgi:hypothetical protein
MTPRSWPRICVEEAPPETSCLPQCDGLECGPDGCGGSCGSCDWDEECESGECVPDEPPCNTYCACSCPCGTCTVEALQGCLDPCYIECDEACDEMCYGGW